VGRSAKSPDSRPPPPRLRRAYHDCRYGQLHLHNAIPAGGGFDELTPVLCVHGSGETGRVFVPLLQTLGYERSVYAPDLPGCGESDPAPGDTSLEAGVNLLADFLDSMRIRTFDLVARGDGQVIAQQLAQARGAAVRRSILLSREEADAGELAVRLLAALGGAFRPT
jgi:pimeloyl-ACP methyl ester carboxylesterase